MNIIRNRPAGWFWIVAVILTLWGLMGVLAFYMDVAMSPEDFAKLPKYDQQLLAARPSWQIWANGFAVWGGLLGSISLLFKRKIATWFYIISLAGILLSMVPVLFFTDIISVKGFIGSAAFPIVIFLISIFQIWFARYSRRHGWLQ